jgi:hypothetical protein
MQENIHPFGFRYCARLDKWSTMAAMTRKNALLIRDAAYILQLSEKNCLQISVVRFTVDILCR